MAEMGRVAKKRGAGKHPSKLRQWSDKSMCQALQAAVRKGKFGIYQAALEYSIP